MAFGSEFWAAVIGALVGAVAGGAIAAWIQLISLKEARRQRQEDRDETREALGNSILLKVMRIHSNNYGLRKDVDDAFKTAVEEGLEWEPWQIVRTFANLPNHFHISTNEMALIFSFGDDDLLEWMSLIDETHNGLIDILGLYSTMRQALTDKLPIKMTGERATAHLTPDQILTHGLKISELNHLANHMRERLKLDLDDSYRTLTKLHEVLTLKLGFTKKMDIEAYPE